MIGLLHGTVHEVFEKEVLVLTSGGVGYALHPAGSLMARCEKGKTITADVLTIVRENEISLYGFGHRDEKVLFEKLISISGIGPKTALGMVSIPTDQFMNAVEQGDVAFLTRIPGLGKKTAERLIIELRGKLDLSAPATASTQTPAMMEAVEALENLGYDRHTIGKRLEAADTTSTAEDLVKFFLASNV